MKLSFKQWLKEWEGNTFLQPHELENGPAYQERGIRSKNKGPGRQDLANPEGDKIRKRFGFDRADFLLALQKMMSKKMGRQ